MSYNKFAVPDLLSSSYEESYMLTKIQIHKKEGKRVKILKCPDEKSGMTFEDVINEFISENSNKYEILDNEGGGDCFFAVLRDALRSVKIETSVQSIRAKLANEVDEEILKTYKDFFGLFYNSIKTTQTQLKEHKKKHLTLKKMITASADGPDKIKMISDAKSNFDKMSSVSEQNKELDELISKSQELTERLVILRYKAYEQQVKDLNKTLTEKGATIGEMQAEIKELQSKQGRLMQAASSAKKTVLDLMTQEFQKKEFVDMFNDFDAAAVEALPDPE